MTEKELEKVCTWIDSHINSYVGWNQWGSLRIIDQDRFKEAIRKALEKHDNH